MASSLASHRGINFLRAGCRPNSRSSGSKLELGMKISPRTFRIKFSSVGTTALKESNPPRSTRVTTTSGTSLVVAAKVYLIPLAERTVIPPNRAAPRRNCLRENPSRPSGQFFIASSGIIAGSKLAIEISVVQSGQ